LTDQKQARLLRNVKGGCFSASPVAAKPHHQCGPIESSTITEGREATVMPGVPLTRLIQLSAFQNHVLPSNRNELRSLAPRPLRAPIPFLSSLELLHDLPCQYLRHCPIFCLHTSHRCN
jgi:hypothetical protein